MSSFTAADARTLVDDMDDIFRAAASMGDMQTVFAREKQNLDTIMRLKRENKSRADVYNTFNAPRFVWALSKQYLTAKRAGQVESVWESVAENLRHYDVQYPTGRRIQPPADEASRFSGQEQTGDQLPIPKPTKESGDDQPTEHTSPTILPFRNDATSLPGHTSASGQPTEHTSPTILPFGNDATSLSGHTSANGQGQTAIPASTIQKPPPAQLSQPLGIPHPSMPAFQGQTDEPASTMQEPPPAQKRRPLGSPPPSKPARPEGLKARVQSPPPSAGPSQPRAPLPTRSRSRGASTSSMKSLPSSYIPGHRIPWRQDVKVRSVSLLEPERSMHAYDSEEYEPSMSIKEPSDKVKHDSKGKEKEVPRSRRDGDRVRRQPVSTGELREKACLRCVRRGMECFHQTLGSACLGCALVKMKCEDVDSKGGEAEKEKPKRRIKTATKRAKQPVTKPKRPATTQGSGKRPTLQGSSMDGSPTPPKQESKRRATSPAPQEPRPKRQTLSKKAEGKRPAREESPDPKWVELTDEVQRLRLFVDALVPGYLRLQERVADMKKESDDTRGALVDLEELLRAERQKVSSLAGECHQLKIRVNVLENDEEEGDEDKEEQAKEDEFRKEWSGKRSEVVEKKEEMNGAMEKEGEGEKAKEYLKESGSANESQEEGLPVRESSTVVQARAVEEPQTPPPPTPPPPPPRLNNISRDEDRPLRESSTGIQARAVEEPQMPPPPTPPPPPTSPPPPPPPPPPPSPPPPTLPAPSQPPPPLTPAITLQLATPLSSQELARLADGSAILKVPATSSANPPVPSPRSRSTSPGLSEPRRSERLRSQSPRRSPRIRSQSPLPPSSSLNLKRPGGNIGHEPTTKRRKE